MIVSRWILFRMKKKFQKILTDKIKIHVLYSKTSTSPPPENRAVYEIISKNVVEPERPQMTIRCMRVECCISKFTRAQEHARTWGPSHTHTHTHTVRMCNTYCFSAVTMVSWTRLNITLYVQGGSNMTGTNCDLFTHKSSRSYLNHLVHCLCLLYVGFSGVMNIY
jgi:hypothetical protein